MKRRISVEEAAKAARVEVMAQTQLWGEVEDTHDVEVEDMIATLGTAVFIGSIAQ
jgi:ATP synthase F1 complex assembly factor 2